MKKTFKNIIVQIITWEAKLVLLRYKPKIVAITGSVGKTSTKDAVYTVLSHFYKVRKSDKSFNSEIGLPLTILGCKNGWSNPVVWLENIVRGLILICLKREYPEYLVLEVGAGKPGDIKSVAPWLRPDVVVLTRFPDVPVHVEFFKGTDHIIEEKIALAEGLKENGILVLNHDDKAVLSVHHKVKRKTVSYGFSEHATYRASYPQIATHNSNGISVPYGMNFKLEYSGNTFPVNMAHIVGESHIYSGLAAIAVAGELGCDMLKATAALTDYETPRSRLAIIEGMNNSIIIDDTYNASPVAMEAAITLLQSISAKRKIAVLGDMLELGKMTEEAHRKTGVQVASVADMLVLVGPRADFIKEAALEAGFPLKELYKFDSSITAGKFLEGVIEKGDVILLKGSQGVRLERAVKAIMAHPEDAKHFLCRQEKEWEKR